MSLLTIFLFCSPLAALSMQAKSSGGGFWTLCSSSGTSSERQCLEDAAGTLKWYTGGTPETWRIEPQEMTNSEGTNINPEYFSIQSHAGRYLAAGHDHCHFTDVIDDTAKWSLIPDGDSQRFKNKGNGRWLEFWNGHEFPKMYYTQHNDGKFTLGKNSVGNHLLQEGEGHKETKSLEIGTGGEFPELVKAQVDKKLMRREKKKSKSAAALVEGKAGKVKSRDPKHWRICSSRSATDKCLEDSGGTLTFYGSASGAETFEIDLEEVDGATEWESIKSFGGNYIKADDHRASFTSTIDDTAKWQVITEGGGVWFKNKANSKYLEFWPGHDHPKMYTTKHPDGTWAVTGLDSGNHL